jgi:predicted outer membrane repeat protein
MASEVNFTGNSAGISGGAIYAQGDDLPNTASVYINAQTKDAVFDSNTANGLPNDVYLGGFAKLELNASSGRTIRINGGISGGENNNEIIKSGAGELILGGSGIHDNYFGLFTIVNGKVQAENNASVSAGKLNIEAQGVYSAKNGAAGQATKLGDAIISGKLELDADMSGLTADTLEISAAYAPAAGGTLDLRYGSALDLNLLNGESALENTRVTLITYNNGGRIDGRMFTSLSIFGKGTNNYLLEYLDDKINLLLRNNSTDFESIPGLTHNQKEVARTFNLLQDDGVGVTGEMIALIDAIALLGNEERKRSFDELAGSIIGNVLTIGAQNRMSGVFERLNEKPADAIWGDISVFGNKYGGDENSIEEFKSSGYALEAGGEIYSGERSIVGIYAGFTKDEIRQWGSKAEANEYGAGIYGGWFKDKINVKARFFGGKIDYSINRELRNAGVKTELEFSAYNIKADAQAEYIISLTETLNLKPFIGLKGGYAVNEKAQETNGGAARLTIYGQSYMRSDALLGAGVDRKGRLSFYAKAYLGYILTGARGEYEGEFTGTGLKMKIWGADREPVNFGAQAGAEYEITKNWSAYANAGGNFSSNASGYDARLGINYRINARANASSVLDTSVEVNDAGAGGAKVKASDEKSGRESILEALRENGADEQWSMSSKNGKVKITREMVSWKLRRNAESKIWLVIYDNKIYAYKDIEVAQSFYDRLIKAGAGFRYVIIKEIAGVEMM